MIRIDQVGKRFKAARGFSFKHRPPTFVHAVRRVSFSAADGCITGLLGPNGAGKTTTLRMLAALIEPDAGTLAVDLACVKAIPRPPAFQPLRLVP